MDERLIEQFVQGMKTAFIHSNEPSNLAYRPQFISNNYKQGRKVVSSIEKELLNCEQFMFSVAFITKGGITPLLPALEELEKKNIPGCILTTDYQYFNDPAILRKLAGFKNIELKMYCTDGRKDGFHTKGYIFKQGEVYRMIVGSSNMTSWALTKNKEWNTKLISTVQGEYANQIIEEFNQLWTSKYAQKYDVVISSYAAKYELIKKQKSIAKQETIPSLAQYSLKPNKMQADFIANLRSLRQKGAKKALLISATGTGKTYASAFALRDANPRKALFIVHREQIAKQALESYKNVLGNEKTYGLLSGNFKDFEADYLFSTMKMMAKTEILSKFRKDEFDIIVIDEVHMAGANSYQRIMEYFDPQLWLGMTASPERTDGFDIFQLFDHNIAYEIRLQQALEEDLLCPFHYFGITDIEIESEVLNDARDVRDFSKLISDVRVDYILEKANYYGYSGDRVKGLVFCSGKNEARELSKKFQERGYRCEFVCGDDSELKREECVERLTNTSRGDYLEYIFTVNIFNEGVDIPEVNQIIMLRPTESPIVFVQQLGRGLRKSEQKEYVVILDFIGNYMNNFMIPIALSGDRSYNKDNLRKYVMEGMRCIPGCSTIHFDRITKERIFKSIDEIKGLKRIIRESYNNLKYKLGRIPNLMDFYENGEIDPELILNEYKTYYAFLQKVETEYEIHHLSDGEVTSLEYLSRIIAKGKRPHEIVILDYIIKIGSFQTNDIDTMLEEKFKWEDNEECIRSAVEVLQGNFVTNEIEKEKYMHLDIVHEKNGFYERMQSFEKKMKHGEFRKYLQDLILLGLKRYEDMYSSKTDRRGPFVLYRKYSRRDVCLLLNWKKDVSSTMYGMKRMDDDVSIFVTYNKATSQGDREYIEGKPDYADEFMTDSREIFLWDSQIGKGIDSSYMRDVCEPKRKHLFIKKSDAEGTDFYYMGQFDIVEIEAGKKKDNKGRLQDITKLKFRLHDPVREDLKDYLESN